MNDPVLPWQSLEADTRLVALSRDWCGIEPLA